MGTDEVGKNRYFKHMSAEGAVVGKISRMPLDPQKQSQSDEQ